MFEDDPSDESFEDTVRSILRELSRSIDRVTQADLDDVAAAIGVDLDRARRLAESTVEWLRGHTDGPHDEGVFWDRGPERSAGDESPPAGGGPHPLDLPTAEQGLALAAVDSGRWTVEPGSGALATDGGRRESRDAAGLVDELRARDWITAQGELTLTGRHALGRWLNAAT